MDRPGKSETVVSGLKQRKCKYYETCPSASGWCLVQQPSGLCVDFLLNYIERIRRENDEH